MGLFNTAPKHSLYDYKPPLDSSSNYQHFSILLQVEYHLTLWECLVKKFLKFIYAIQEYNAH